MEETTIMRSDRPDGYTIIDNRSLKDGQLSFKARGILSFLLSLPNNWRIYASFIQKHTVEGRSSVESGLEELEKLGYLEKLGRAKGTRGFAGYEYRLYEHHTINEKYESAVFSPKSKNSDFKNSYNQQHKGVDFQQLINTNIKNTKDKELLRNSKGISQNEIQDDFSEKEILPDVIQPEKIEKDLQPGKESEENPQSFALSEPLLTATGKLGLDETTLEFVHELYSLFGISSARLPKVPSDTSHSTLNKIIDCFNSIRAGTFTETHKIDAAWLKTNKVPESLSKQIYSSWGSFHREVLKSAERYLSVQKSKPCTVLRFFHATRGPGGVIVPPYSLFLKYLNTEPVTDVSEQISKIQEKYEKTLRDLSENFYNRMLDKYNQTFTDFDKLRFWTGIDKLVNWYTANIEKIGFKNPDGNYKTHMGNVDSFLNTLFKWLDEGGGAWGALYPDLIVIDGKQWGQFVTYCKTTLNIDIRIEDIEESEYLSQLYEMEKEKRYKHRESAVKDKVEVLTEKLADELEISWEEAEKKAEAQISGEYFTKDLEWEEAWEERLTKAKKEKDA